MESLRDNANRMAKRLTELLVLAGHYSTWVRHFHSFNPSGRLTPRMIAGDTKAGTLIGVDRYGNKFYENMEEELPRKRDHS